jgi:hypothetical protein
LLATASRRGTIKPNKRFELTLESSKESLLPALFATLPGPTPLPHLRDPSTRQASMLNHLRSSSLRRHSPSRRLRIVPSSSSRRAVRVRPVVVEMGRRGTRAGGVVRRRGTSGRSRGRVGDRGRAHGVLARRERGVWLLLGVLEAVWVRRVDGGVRGGWGRGGSLRRGGLMERVSGGPCC